MRFSGVVSIVSLVAVAVVGSALHPTVLSVAHAQQDEALRANAGQLVVFDEDGEVKAQCPLEHTDVRAEISGFLSRVTVTQNFANPYDTPIEAVYTFPLPNSAAVDHMTMTVGERTIRGRILRRDEAREVYDEAREAGQVASLLDQERPNIFTQSVANIMPGERIRIEISYVETLEYEDGSYRFVFPMVVGPRYIPGNPTGKQGDGFSPDTDRVPDASRITPHVTPEGTRAGHDISLSVTLDAGVPLLDLRSTLHKVDVARLSDRAATVTLTNQNEIPNRDFILTYDVAGRQIQDAVIAHRSGDAGYFTLVLQPPSRVAAEDVTPKELVFVLDTSGSMSGFPIEKAKETMKLALDGLYDRDTFNLITFAGDTRVLFEKPVPATAENLRRAQEFLASQSGGGGTEMMKAIQTALAPSGRGDAVRVVCFMTDGEVGNEDEILAEIRRNAAARVFAFGVGNSVNRYLLDAMAREGRGEVEYVTLEDDGSAAARRFHERVRSPLLTDIEVDWGGLPVTEMTPTRVPDVFSAKPVVIIGKYTRPGKGTIRVRGKAAGRVVERKLKVELPRREAAHDVVAKLWARERIEAIARAGAAMLDEAEDDEYDEVEARLEERIVALALEHGLMTAYTSFVAVEDQIVTEGGKPRKVEVPVELPSGVSRLALPSDEFSGPSQKTGFAYLERNTSLMGGSGSPPSPPNMTPVCASITVATGSGAGSGDGRNALELVPLGARAMESIAVPPPEPVGVTAAELLEKAIWKVLPSFPTQEGAMQLEGTVEVELLVDEIGEVVSSHVATGDPRLRDACIRALEQWRFRATTRDGRPVRVLGTISFRFEKGRVSIVETTRAR